jgi:hypothetical protein
MWSIQSWVAVEDDVGLVRGDFRRIGQIGCQRGQEFDRLVDVSADGGQADTGPGGETGAGVAAP